MAHIKRRDSLFLALQSVIMIVYFFDPLIWITNHRINFYRECLCDRLALKTSRLNPVQYGKSLIKVLSFIVLKSDILSPSPALGHYHKELAKRFQLLTGGISMQSPKKWHRIGLVFILMMTVLPFARSGDMQSLNSESKIQDNVQKAVIQFINPLPSGKMTLGFGPARDPFSGMQWKHIGIDLAAIIGEPIKASADGQVIEAVEEYVVNEGRGIYLTIQHQDGFRSNYSHLQSIKVKKGDQVHAGDVIAAVGSTGRSTGPHLHFELIKDNEPVNPQEYIDFKK
jgi:murein DD-endopeptidase MepM/ murein hydrolase activator NlpD